MERFWKNVKKTETCWIWTGSLTTVRKNDKGSYGSFFYNGKNRKAHRISYEIHKGPIPNRLVIDHLCRNRSCVNPDHLEAVTHQINITRGVGTGAVNAKKTHCLNGHELNIQNVLKRKDGGRLCKICHAMRGKEFIKRHGSVWQRMTPEQRERASIRVRKWKDKNIPKAEKKTHCVHGHSLHDAFIKKNGTRSCRECSRIRCKERYHQRHLLT